MHIANDTTGGIHEMFRDVPEKANQRLDKSKQERDPPDRFRQSTTLFLLQAYVPREHSRRHMELPRFEQCRHHIPQHRRAQDRAVYRTAELADGWNGQIIATQVYFSQYPANIIV